MQEHVGRCCDSALLALGRCRVLVHRRRVIWPLPLDYSGGVATFWNAHSLLGVIDVMRIHCRSLSILFIVTWMESSGDVADIAAS